MAVSCDRCGAIVTANQDTPHLSGARWYFHRTGRCSKCGAEFQWHRGISGRSGTGYLAAARSTPCPPSCPQHNPGAAVGNRV
jgi:DNA-directed RNA polymerase subunit RPC12/RpoP